MTALSVSKKIRRRGSEAVPPMLGQVPIKASLKVLEGALVGINQSGYLDHASADSTLYIAGVARSEVDNSSGSAGALSCDVERGVFGFVNSGTTDALTAADVGRPAYVVDNQTVARTDAGGTRPFAGYVREIGSDSLVYVQVGVMGADPRCIDLLIVAAADLSSLQFTFVKNSGGTLIAASAAGEDVLGVLQNAPANGAIAIVRVLGPSTVVGSASIAIGARIATTSAGRSKGASAAVTNTSDAGAASDPLIGSFVMGVALSACSGNGSQHQILVTPMGAIPTTAA